MKKIVLYISFAVAGVLVFSCEKEELTNNQNKESRILSSNPDEIYVQHPKTGEWITLTEYNALFNDNTKSISYGKRQCKVTNADGSESLGESCSPAPYGGCSGQGLCVIRN
jgi:hypothetical protein